MRRPTWILSVAVVAVAVGALVATGAVKVRDAPAASNQARAGAASEKPVSTVRPSVAAATCFDYNGVLSGLGWPWLKPATFGLLGGGGAPPGVSGSACLPGVFAYAGTEVDFRWVYFISGLSLDSDGCPVDTHDVYRRVIAMNPFLTGFDRYVPPHQLTADEKAMFGLDESTTLVFSDAPITSRPASTWGPMLDLLQWLHTPIQSRPAWDGDKNVMAGLLTWYASMPISILGETPERALKELETAGGADCAGNSAPPSRPSPTPTPTPGDERRRYVVTLSGYEIDEMNPYWKVEMKNGWTAGRAAARYDYRLAGTFTLRKQDDGWVFEEGAITAADVSVVDLFAPTTAWEVIALRCRGCEELRRSTRLTGFVEDGAVVLNWGRFRPQVDYKVRITVPCKPMPSCAAWGNQVSESSELLDRVSDARLPLRDAPTSITFPNVVDSFGVHWIGITYDLKRVQ
jgi:hypothetical protein